MEDDFKLKMIELQGKFEVEVGKMIQSGAQANHKIQEDTQE
jgi:hypothetical protein